MNEKEAITSVVAIGENTHRYLEKIKERMTLEETDVRDWNEMFEYGLKISQFNFISANVDLNSSVIKEIINDIPVCFIIIDAGYSKSLNYTRQLGDYIRTLDCGLSIALVLGIYNNTLPPKDITKELYSHVDVIIELDTLATDDSGKVNAAYNIIRGINSTLVKPLLCGFDLADLHLHLKSSGLLQVAWAIENSELDSSYSETLQIATQSALEVLKKRVIIEEVRSVFIFIEGRDTSLNIIDIEKSIMIVNNTFPESVMEWVGSTSKTIGNEVRVLLGAAYT